MVALFRLAFATASDQRPLTLQRRSNSPDHYAKGTPSRGLSEDKHSASTDCRRTVSGTISLPLLGFFSPFPHGTSSLSVAEEYLALEGGPPRFRRGFTCPVLLRNGSGGRRLSSTGLSPTMARLSCAVQLAFAFVTPM